jgi:UDP-glucose 4-epimerase
MTKVVVFRGSGFLGSYLADELTKQKFEVVIADVEESKYINSQQSFVSCDIMDRDKVVIDMEHSVIKRLALP